MQVKSKVAVDMKNHFKAIREKQSYLGLALHCLQDSFSPAHTLRRAGPLSRKLSEPSARFHDSGDVRNPAPIRSIYVYASQDHGKHADDDCSAGTLNSSLAAQAAQASADLLKMGIEAILEGRKASGWDAFQDRWLKWGGRAAFI